MYHKFVFLVNNGGTRRRCFEPFLYPFQKKKQKEAASITDAASFIIRRAGRSSLQHVYVHIPAPEIAAFGAGVKEQVH